MNWLCELLEQTSMIHYLAKRTGHRLVRINNHEHTDIQEHIGQYITDSLTGKLKFQEGILVEAVKNVCNPSIIHFNIYIYIDIFLFSSFLESMIIFICLKFGEIMRMKFCFLWKGLLDRSRRTESRSFWSVRSSQSIVRWQSRIVHSRNSTNRQTAFPFHMLFATQNPPGIYGGRKVQKKISLSVFLHFFSEH